MPSGWNCIQFQPLVFFAPLPNVNKLRKNEYLSPAPMAQLSVIFHAEAQRRQGAEERRKG
jgi:hypothetical protein